MIFTTSLQLNGLLNRFIYRQIGLNCGFHLGWEFLEGTSREGFYHRVPQKMIGTALQNLFTSLAAYLYFFVGCILTTHYRSFVTKDHDQSMRELDRLNQSYHFVTRKFGPVLLMVVLQSFISTITSSYFLIRSLMANQTVFFLWDAFQFTENLTKIVVICYTADKQLESLVFYLFKCF